MAETGMGQGDRRQRVAGIEPVSSAWEADVLAGKPRPDGVSARSANHLLISLGSLGRIADAASKIIKQAIKDGDPYYATLAERIREEVRGVRQSQGVPD